jgi:hypothetical protein
MHAVMQAKRGDAGVMDAWPDNLALQVTSRVVV